MDIKSSITAFLILAIIITIGYNSAGSSDLPLEIVPCTFTNCSGTVIFLHGSGGTGRETRDYVREKFDKEFTFTNLKIVYPTAPLQHYSDTNMPRRIWFDRLELNQTSPEQLQSVNKMAVKLNKLIDDEIASGTSPSRIIVGGFSMGGSMSLILGLRFRHNLPGIFALSSFLNDDSEVYADLSRSNYQKYPTVFFAHGSEDNVVPLEWNMKTQAYLGDLGINITFRPIENLKHEVSKDELVLLHDWILNILGY